MVIPIANLSAVVTGAVHAAMGYAIEMLPTDVTRDAVLETVKASVAWFLRHLWAWLVAARAVAVENLPEAAASAVESSGPWLQMAVKIFHGLCRWLLAAGAMAVEKLPDATAAVEMLPTDVTRDAVLETVKASVAWLLRHLWAWLVAARAVAVENLPEAAASAVESSRPWLQMAVKIFHGLCRWLLAAGAMAVEKLPDATAAKRAARSTFDAPWLEMASKLWHGLYARLVAAGDVSVRNLPDGDAMGATGGGGGAESMSEASSPSLPSLAWFLRGHAAAVYVLLALALLGVVFLCGAVWALTCRTMKGPGLGGARIPRAMFKANPRLYYAAVRKGRKARRGASGAGWKLLVVAPIVAYAAYLAAKKLY